MPPGKQDTAITAWVHEAVLRADLRYKADHVRRILATHAGLDPVFAQTCRTFNLAEYLDEIANYLDARLLAPAAPKAAPPIVEPWPTLIYVADACTDDDYDAYTSDRDRVMKQAARTWNQPVESCGDGECHFCQPEPAGAV